MSSKSIQILIMLTLLSGGCAPIYPTQQSDLDPATEITILPGSTPSAVAHFQLPNTDEVLFRIPNPEPFCGREGEARPDWLGWGAGTFTVAPDGSFWIADTAEYPNRLLHYSPEGEFLQKISLENKVTYVYDLAVTQNSLWLLDISSQPPKIVQLTMDDNFQSLVSIPEEIMTLNGQIISNGAFDLSLGEKGELLVFGLNGYYEIIDDSGQITNQHLDSLEYYNHTYQAGIYMEALKQLPIIVDGTRLDIDPAFSVEMPFLGMNPDGSFAIAGTVEDADHQIDHQVRYYDPSGRLMGIARQQPQTIHKDWNHHLAFGPDGAVYQLLSNPDHSVQILRLGFSDELSSAIPVLMPAPTATPMSMLMPSGSETTNEELAKNALLAFFSALARKNYDQAAVHFGGQKTEYAREPMPNETPGEYWDYICNTVLWCLPVGAITNTEQISEDEYIFSVVFLQPDGTRFELGACCGGDPAADPPVWQFDYPVKKIDGVWKVMREPVFTP